MAPCPVLLLPLLLLLQQTCSLDPACEELTCFMDYLEMLACTWGEEPHPSRPNFYNLTAQWNCGKNESCLLLPVDGKIPPTHFACLAEQKLCLGDKAFEVRATEATPGAVKGCQRTFLLKKNIKPQPPFNLTVSASPSGYNISWETPYQHRSYLLLRDHLHHQLRFQKRGRSWQGQAQKHLLLQDTRFLWLESLEFEAGTEYELQVRSQPRSPYEGTWSTWSPPAFLSTPPKTSDSRKEPRGPSKWLLLSLVLLPVPLALLGRRLWKRLESFIPSPAPFFQPLYLSHKGDFKKWVGSPGPSTMLEVSEWCPGVGPEALGRGSFKLLALLPPCEVGHGGHDGAGWAEPLPMQEQPCGLLSIDTVTVDDAWIGACCPQCGHCIAEEPLHAEEEGEGKWVDVRDAYRRIEDSSNGEPLLESPPERNPHLPSSPLLLSNDAPATPPPFQGQVQGSLGRGPAEGPLFFFGPTLALLPPPERSLMIPEEEAPSYSTLLSLYSEAEDEGDPEGGLDLDTIDSGFMDCDSGSPLDPESGKKPPNEEGEAAAGDTEEREASLPSYVKQWVSGHKLKA
nr:interleukin-21 receptor [Anolis sagrei ordinatus]